MFCHKWTGAVSKLVFTPKSVKNSTWFTSDAWSLVMLDASGKIWNSNNCVARILGNVQPKRQWHVVQLSCHTSFGPLLGNFDGSLPVAMSPRQGVCRKRLGKLGHLARTGRAMTTKYFILDNYNIYYIYLNIYTYISEILGLSYFGGFLNIQNG